MNLNRVIIVGRLTQDPELRNTPSGTPVCSFGVATNRVWNNRSTGEQESSTEYHNVVAWRRLAEIIAQYLNKGNLVLIEGRLQTRSWETPSGDRRRTTEIVANNVQLPPRSMSQDSSPSSQPSQQKQQPEQKTKEEDIPVIEEDEENEIDVEDIPF